MILFRDSTSALHYANTVSRDVLPTTWQAAMEALILIATLWLATIQKRLNALLALGWGRPFKSTFVSQLAQSADIRLIVRHHCGVIRERYPAKANAAQKEGDEDSERRNQKAQVDALAI